MAADTRNRILQAATQLFWEKGYGSTSVADILERTGIHSGSLYHFFPGKQDVLIGVLRAHRDEIVPLLIEPAWQGVDDPIERVFALLESYRQKLLETGCRIACPIGSLALELHDPDERVRELIKENFDTWLGAVEDCLDEAADRLPRDIDRRSLAEEVFSAMQGWGMQCRTHRDIAFFDRGMAMLRDHFDRLTAPQRRELEKV